MVTVRPVVLLTGATGFVGRHAVSALANRGAAVHAVSRAGLPALEATPWAVNLLDHGRVVEVVQSIRPTHLLHLAWEATPGRFWNSSDNLDWLAASVRLVRVAVEAGCKRVTVAGTCAEYDWSIGSGVFQEDAPTRPATLYGVCKDATRRVIQEYCGPTGAGWAWGRIFNSYGPGEPSTKLVASVVRAVRAGEPARCSRGAQERDYMHVSDVADALAALTLCEVGGLVNIASGIGVSVAEVARTIGHLAGRPELIRLGEVPDRSTDAPRVIADITRLTGEVAWKPKFDLASGLVATMSSYS